MTNDQCPMTILNLIFLGLGRTNRQVRQELLNEKNPKSQIPNHKPKIQWKKLNAVTIFRTNNFNHHDFLLFPVSFSPFLSLNLFSLYSASLLMTNDQSSCSFFLCRKKNQKRQRLKNISRGFAQSQRMEFKAQKLSSSPNVSDRGKGYG